jgi:membrane protein YfhO
MAYSGVIGLGLALIGAFSHKSRTPWVMLVVIGFLLALGVYNPLYWVLVKLPGFSFFRVPARWLALVALGLAVLAGAGLQSLKTARPHGWVYLVIIAVIGALGASSFLSDRMAVDVTGPALPTMRTLAGWGTALVILLAATIFVGERRTRYITSLLVGAAVVELFFASQILPYNELVPSDVYTASRFTIRQLQVYGENQTPPGRILSISPLQFDPGDADALKNRYATLGMSDLAVRIALVDTKLREIVGPNLPLEWGVPSIDGFDGGLLPSDYYSQFTTLLLPPGQEATSDGRLRELLAQPECRGACIPDQRWLNLTNTRYLITDKVGEFWQNDVAYDPQFEVTVQPGTVYTPVVDAPDFVANAVDVLYKGDTPLRWGSLSAVPLPPLDPAAAPGLEGYQLARFQLEAPADHLTLRLESDSIVQIRAITLVDTRVSEVFHPLALGAWQRDLSSDIKLYENTSVQPRAFLPQQVQSVSDDAAALDMMRKPEFDPALLAVVTGSESGLSGELAGGVAQITGYTPERVEIHVNTSAAGLLVLTDAHYPGWIATVNGQSAAIYRTDIMFRGVRVSAGESTVIIEYRPWWWPGVPVLGGIAWVALIIGWFVMLFRRRTP